MCESDAKSSERIFVRKAKESDAGEILGIYSHETEHGRTMLREWEEFRGNEENERETIIKYANSDGCECFVAEQSGRVVGFLRFDNGSLRKTRHSGMLFMIVREDCRGKGVGSVLLGALIVWAQRSTIVEKLTLAHFHDNEIAHKLYEKFGFVEEGNCPRDMKLDDGTYLDSILMYRYV